MAEINVSELIHDIKQAASTILNKDVSTLRGFSERQVKALAKQGQIIAKGALSGEIEGDLLDYFLDSLEEMALNFVKTLKGLLMVTIEKVWNAIVKVIWEAINTATGLAIPI